MVGTGRQGSREDMVPITRWTMCDDVMQSAKCEAPSLGLQRRDDMSYESINFKQKFDLFNEQWQPKVIAEMNDYQFKVVKLQGDFIWHDHQDTDEAFIVLEGELRIDFRDGAVHLSSGEMFVVPKGTMHKP